MRVAALNSESIFGLNPFSWHPERTDSKKKRNVQSPLQCLTILWVMWVYTQKLRRVSQSRSKSERMLGQQASCFRMAYSWNRRSYRFQVERKTWNFLRSWSQKSYLENFPKAAMDETVKMEQKLTLLIIVFIIVEGTIGVRKFEF